MGFGEFNLLLLKTAAKVLNWIGMNKLNLNFLSSPNLLLSSQSRTKYKGETLLNTLHREIFFFFPDETQTNKEIISMKKRSRKKHSSKRIKLGGGNQMHSVPCGLKVGGSPFLFTFQIE